MSAKKTDTKTKTDSRKKETADEKKQLQRIGALWLGEGRNGKYMSGRLQLADETEIRILVFKNNYKEKDSQPDYIIYEPDSERVSDIPF